MNSSKISNDRKEMDRYKTALIISSLYVVTMLTIGVMVGDSFNKKIVSKFFFQRQSISLKYLAIISLSGIFIFVMTCLVVKKFNKDKLAIENSLKNIEEKEAAIESASKRVNKQKKIITNILESGSVFIISFDEDLNIVNASENIKDITNFKVRDIREKPLSIIIDEGYLKEIKKGLSQADKYELEVEFKTKFGKRTYTHGTIKKEEDKRYTFVLYDISQRKSLQEKISYLDSYDSLTDLPNRDLMERIFTASLPKINRDGSIGAFLFIDIDHFAFINETKGHHAGDYLLMDMAVKLKENKKDGDILGRITQDKFVMIITGEESLEDLDRRIAKISKAIHMEWKFEEKSYIISTTIGVSLFPKDGLDFVVLLKSANLALECAKESARTGYEYYNKEKKCMVLTDLSIVSDIKIALKEGQFKMHYQPIYDLQTDEIENLESLIRWKHPERGYVSPEVFIAAAERSWVIDDIGEYTLEEVFRQKAEWNKQGYKLPRISINISAITFSKPDFGQYIEEKLSRYGLEGDEVVLELTESGFSTHKTKIKKNVEYLRALGVRISMDDFGTGYSSLARLRELQIDDMKLDRTFVVSLLEENGQEIIKTLISLAKALGKDIVSEGIETEEQRQILKDMGSKYGQGYFLSRPMPSDQVEELLKKEDEDQDKDKKQ